MRQRAWISGLAIAGLLLVAGGIAWWYGAGGRGGPDRPGRHGERDLFGSGQTETYTVTRTEYHPPPAAADENLVDDRLEDKRTTFDPELIDRRPLGDWLLNLSEAVIQLDAPLVRPDVEPALLALHPSYAAALAAARSSLSAYEVLPSVNLVDGKAKQFDDGLYAALDQAYYSGLERTFQSHVRLIEQLYRKVGPDSPVAPFLAAGLELAGETVTVASAGQKDRWLREFLGNQVLSKPISFYTWNQTLSDAFRFLRFFQQRLDATDPVARALAEALGADDALREDYGRAVDFYARLTNPPACPLVTDLIGRADPMPPSRVVAVFPPSTSREVELFRKLFPLGLPPGADLMRELIRRIRSGEVDLTPRPDSGWYDHQVYALETLLVPEQGPEHDKLLLTRAYKKRMLEAFRALMTKRRETHVRQLDFATGSAAPAPLEKVAARLRVEPCPSYYLRTARAYAFLADFLDSAVGADALQGLHGLREGGQRDRDLHAELGLMRELFYGLHLLSCEDIGMGPALREDEPVDRARCEQVASEWLADWPEDPDLAVDTRVAVPIYVDPMGGVTRHWATLGVRLTKLEASFARPPRARPKEGPGGWEAVEPYKLEAASYLIPVDAFAEVELKGFRTLTRPELRAVCDAQQTKEAIVGALQQ